jgi:hypothetical protein
VKITSKNVLIMLGVVHIPPELTFVLLVACELSSQHLPFDEQNLREVNINSKPQAILTQNCAMAERMHIPSAKYG